MLNQFLDRNSTIRVPDVAATRFANPAPCGATIRFAPATRRICSANGIFSGLEGILCGASGFAVGLCVNYVLSITVVFDNRSMKNVWHERIIFVAIALIGLALHSAIIWICQNRLGFRFETAKVTATAITLVWNFLSKKLTIFR